MTFTILDYEKMRSQWGKFIKHDISTKTKKYLGIRFDNNRLTVGVKKADDKWEIDVNYFTQSLEPGFAAYEAKFVIEVNDMIHTLS